jgi:hypothetical protein
MKYRGIEYQVVQVVGERGGGRGCGRGARDLWKWSIRIDPHTSASGTEANRLAAIAAAEKKIDGALAPK